MTTYPTEHHQRFAEACAEDARQGRLRDLVRQCRSILESWHNGPPEARPALRARLVELQDQAEGDDARLLTYGKFSVLYLDKAIADSLRRARVLPGAIPRRSGVPPLAFLTQIDPNFRDDDDD
ncbi:MAG: hypothetical protein M1457_00815 [bacterium]|nr:hypothetical protein [bacterium]